jgi:hypothetical protein
MLGLRDLHLSDLFVPRHYALQSVRSEGAGPESLGRVAGSGP